MLVLGLQGRREPQDVRPGRPAWAPDVLRSSVCGEPLVVRNPFLMLTHSIRMAFLVLGPQILYRLLRELQGWRAGGVGERLEVRWPGWTPPAQGKQMLRPASHATSGHHPVSRPSGASCMRPAPSRGPWTCTPKAQCFSWSPGGGDGSAGETSAGLLCYL